MSAGPPPGRAARVLTHARILPKKGEEIADGHRQLGAPVARDSKATRDAPVGHSQL